MFLARHLDALATRDLAWWQLVDTISRTTRGISVGLAAGLVFGFVGVLAGTGIADTPYRLVVILVFGLVFGAATGLSYGVNKRPEPVRVETRFRGTLAPFFRRFTLGLLMGVGVGLGISFSSEEALAAGLTFGFALAAPLWLDIPAEVAKVSSPGVILKQDRTAALSSSLVLALPFGLAGDLAVGLPTELAFGVVGGFVFGPPVPGSHPVAGLAYGVTFGLAVGCVGVLSRAWGAYAVSRIWLALRGDQPWRLMRFLEDAHRRGVLRQSGAMYQFRHARVQDHLARADPSPH